jgi:hypothetical protein
LLQKLADKAKVPAIYLAAGIVTVFTAVILLVFGASQFMYACPIRLYVHDLKCYPQPQFPFCLKSMPCLFPLPSRLSAAPSFPFRSNLIGFLVPLHFSVHALAPEDSVEECKQWLAYFVFFGAFVIVGDFTWIDELPFYVVFKLVALAFAAHNHGALNIFRSFLLPSLKKWEYVPAAVPAPSSASASSSLSRAASASSSSSSSSSAKSAPLPSVIGEPKAE